MRKLSVVWSMVFVFCALTGASAHADLNMQKEIADFQKACTDGGGISWQPSWIGSVAHLKCSYNNQLLSNTPHFLAPGVNPKVDPITHQQTRKGVKLREGDKVSFAGYISYGRKAGLPSVCENRVKSNGEVADNAKPADASKAGLYGALVDSSGVATSFFMGGAINPKTITENEDGAEFFAGINWNKDVLFDCYVGYAGNGLVMERILDPAHPPQDEAAKLTKKVKKAIADLEEVNRLVNSGAQPADVSAKLAEATNLLKRSIGESVPVATDALANHDPMTVSGK